MVENPKPQEQLPQVPLDAHVRVLGELLTRLAEQKVTSPDDRVMSFIAEGSLVKGYANALGRGIDFDEVKRILTPSKLAVGFSIILQTTTSEKYRSKLGEVGEALDVILPKIDLPEKEGADKREATGSYKKDILAFLVEESGHNSEELIFEYSEPEKITMAKDLIRKSFKFRAAVFGSSTKALKSDEKLDDEHFDELVQMHKKDMKYGVKPEILNLIKGYVLECKESPEIASRILGNDDVMDSLLVAVEVANGRGDQKLVRGRGMIRNNVLIQKGTEEFTKRKNLIGRLIDTIKKF